MKLKINSQIFPCEVKNSSEGLKTGMMGRGSLDGCMLFFLPYKGEQSFWMYDCLIPLDIIFCNDDAITEIHHHCAPCEREDECIFYKGFGNIVIEFNAGTAQELNLKVGEKIRLIQH